MWPYEDLGNFNAGSGNLMCISYYIHCQTVKQFKENEDLGNFNAGLGNLMCISYYIHCQTVKRLRKVWHYEDLG